MDKMSFAERVAYTGVGLTAYVFQKTKETLESLIEEDKISAEHGEQIINELAKDAQKIREEVTYELEDSIKKIKSAFAKEDDSSVVALQKRLENLESKHSSSS